MHPNFTPALDNFAFDKNWILDRMLFISGPRQIGKTTFIKNKIFTIGGSYYNWDNPDVRLAYNKSSSFFVDKTKAHSLVVFDEIHKRNKWKDILKGIYDVHKTNYRFVVTGSARLDTFKRSGDSLVGRYFTTHMFPISPNELQGTDFKEFSCAHEFINVMRSECGVQKNISNDLISLGGFPEPFFTGSVSFWRRWQKQYQDLLIQEDLRDLSNIQRLDSIELLVNLLKQKVSSTVSYNSLVNDLQADNKSIKSWIAQLEKLMMVFSIKPWSKQINKSFRKNPKIYFYDWTLVSEPGARFENFLALQIFRTLTLWNDRFGYDFELFFIRDYNDNEVDFCISLNSKPWLLIESKLGSPRPSSSLNKIKATLGVPSIIVTNERNWNTFMDDNYIVDIDRFLAVLS